MSITLYAAPMSSATAVVQAIEELGAPVEIAMICLNPEDPKKKALFDINPNGKVPTLVVEGAPMFETLAIHHYLADRFGVDAGLWPSAEDPRRLEAQSWTTWSYVTFGAALTRLLVAHDERFPKELHSEALAKYAQNELQQLLGILDARLRDRKYLLGDEFGLVDLVVGCVVTYGSYVGLETAGHDNVLAWLARFHARPSFAKAWNAEA